MDLNRDDCDLILQSLEYTRRRFEIYPYPTEQGRRERLADVDAATAKVRVLRRQTKQEVDA